MPKTSDSCEWWGTHLWWAKDGMQAFESKWNCLLLTKMFFMGGCALIANYLFCFGTWNESWIPPFGGLAAITDMLQKILPFHRKKWWEIEGTCSSSARLASYIFSYILSSLGNYFLNEETCQNTLWWLISHHHCFSQQFLITDYMI